MLEIISFELGPIMTNSYLVADSLSEEATIIDPAWDGKIIVEAANQQNWQIKNIWLTHAHFDHLAGTGEVIANVNPAPPISLHPEDFPLWRIQGGAPYFGMQIDPGPEPNVKLKHGQHLNIGEYLFEVRHTPGHTPGHVIFYCAAEKVLFVGDLVFQGSIGRTDLPGGSYKALIDSIHSEVLSLEDETRILTGHGPETTVGKERYSNPYFANF